MIATDSQIVEKNIPVNPRTGKKREATANDFLSVGAMKLPEEAKYDYLANLPASKDIANEINNSMKLIEAEYPDLSGILPKNYQEFESDLLRDLIRVFNKDAVKKATGDVFGRIYEYFLMKFSMQGAGAQEGGEFFTPPSLVQLIVNFIEPDHGIIHDPACGSGGMFVQTGYFVRNHSNKEVNEAIKCYGTEQKTNNTKLAKMNLAIHGIEGKINTTINDFSPGQLLNLTTIIKLYRGEKNVYQNAFAEHQQMLNEYLEKIHEHYKALAKGLNDAAKDLNIDLKVITEIKFDKPAKHQEAENIFKQFNVPVEAASVFINKWQEEIAATEKKSAEKKTDEKEGSSSEVLTKEEKKQISTLRGNITALNKPIIIFSEATKEYSEHTKQGTNDWKHFMEWFPDGKYQDIEGLCKIVSLGEIKESEYSLTPGRYVGVSLQLDEGFDYKGRLTEIQEGLDNLNKEASQLAKTISDNFKELAI